MRRGIFITVILASSFTFPLCAYAQWDAQSQIRWTVVESSYTTVYIDADIDLKRLNKRIDVNFARYDPIERRLFLNKGTSETERLANKIDIIVRKAKKILDMHPPGYHVKIKVFKDNRNLVNEYSHIFGEEREYRAYYIHKYRTIYTSLQGISESVLAHEIGHSIIDSYFNVLPPQKVRELLACYVDVHLKD